MPDRIEADPSKSGCRFIAKQTSSISMSSFVEGDRYQNR